MIAKLIRFKKRKQIAFYRLSPESEKEGTEPRDLMVFLKKDIPDSDNEYMIYASELQAYFKAHGEVPRLVRI